MATKMQTTEVNTMSEEDLFDDAEVVENVSEEETQEDEAQEEFMPTISKDSEKDKLAKYGQKAEANGKIVTIKSWAFTKPKTKDFDGKKIEPKLTQTNNKPFYPGKLVIRFKEEDLVEYYPNIKYYVNEKGINTNIKLPRTGENEVAKIVQKVLAKIGKPSEEVSDLDILNYLIDKKVELKTSKGVFNKKPWFRNDIEKFVE